MNSYFYKLKNKKIFWHIVKNDLYIKAKKICPNIKMLEKQNSYMKIHIQKN